MATEERKDLDSLDNWNQKDLFERKNNMKNQNSDFTRLNDTQKRAAIERYIELRKTLTTQEAREQIGVAAPDTIYRWAERFGLVDQVKIGHNSGKGTKKKTPPQLISVRADTEFQPQPREREAKKPHGNIVVIMGDPESVKSALQSAFNVVTHK